MAGIPTEKTATGRTDKVRVYALERGTVIDHVRRGAAMRVLRMLDLDPDTTVAVGLSFDSTKLGKKDMIKLEDHFLDDETSRRIALISPEATVAKIDGGKVVEKRQVVVPDRIDGLMTCANPRCISRNEPMTPRFTRVGVTGPLRFRCVYCEREMDEGDMKDHLK